MKRVTEYYNLGAVQSGVDFVDVDVEGDVPVFIDPRAIRVQSGDWTDRCIESLQTYFEALLAAIKSGDESAIRTLIEPLVEPNETHLGLSAGKSRGRGLGTDSKAEELIEGLRSSKAAASGFLRDLEDTALLVEGIDRDIISDITTCVIRRQLIDYTQSESKFHGITLESQESGPMWDSASRSWVEGFVDLPRAAGDKLLLVPKSIVRATMTLDKGKYYRGYLRPYFEQEVLKSPSSGLVRVLKDKSRKVLKGKLDEEIGTTKAAINEHTEKYPRALVEYRGALDKQENSPLPDERMQELLGTKVETLTEMLDEVKAISPGKAGANSYHRAIAKFLTALFDTQLGNERIETPLHDGLKRIDITYDNVAGAGFFHFMKNYPTAMVVVECKNYGSELGNPEFDQIAMRFSPQRGQFGLLVCRNLSDSKKAFARARSIATDTHGYVVVLTDDDLDQLVRDVASAGTSLKERMAFPLLRERFNALIGA